jgi:hypothetical protein
VVLVVTPLLEQEEEPLAVKAAGAGEDLEVVQHPEDQVQADVVAAAVVDLAATQEAFAEAADPLLVAGNSPNKNRT